MTRTRCRGRVTRTSGVEEHNKNYICRGAMTITRGVEEQ